MRVPVKCLTSGANNFSKEKNVPVRVITPSGEKFELQVGQDEDLARCIWLSGRVPPRALCGGLGRCGACRVRFLSPAPQAGPVEREVLGTAELEQGWRLACRHPAREDMVVEVPEPERTAWTRNTPARETGADPAGEELFLAVDLGTTSVCWRAETASGDIAAEGAALNPQIGAGSEVISRLAVARTPEGRSRLREAVLDLLRDVVKSLPGSVAGACVAGNTAMTAILLDRDVSALARAPYKVPDPGGRDVSLPGLPGIWIPPQPAPFAGGDVSAGMARLLAGSPVFPFLLADMGTNGEFALALGPEETLLASVPLGPSLEGIGLSHGGLAGPGSVVGFRLSPGGLDPVPWRDNVSASVPLRRISGTGYLSLLDLLLRAGFLGSEGELLTPATPLALRLSAGVRRERQGWVLALPGGLALTARDVEELLKVKAAFSLAFAQLLAEADLSPARVNVILGGALGRHAPLESLENLGFLPPGSARRVRAAGNTSLDGALLLARETDRREGLIRWSRTCRVLDLTAAPDFTARYLDHMRWGWRE